MYERSRFAVRCCAVQYNKVRQIKTTTFLSRLLPKEPNSSCDFNLDPLHPLPPPNASWTSWSSLWLSLCLINAHQVASTSHSARRSSSVIHSVCYCIVCCSSQSHSGHLSAAQSAAQHSVSAAAAQDKSRCVHCRRVSVWNDDAITVYQRVMFSPCSLLIHLQHISVHVLVCADSYTLITNVSVFCKALVHAVSMNTSVSQV